jgi:hypothetical protein
MEPTSSRTRFRTVPTQFKATQLAVAIAVWAKAVSARGAHPNLSILLLNDASEQYCITIGRQRAVSIGQRCIIANCY